MASALEGPAAAEQTRFITATMSDGTVMKVAVDGAGATPASLRKVQTAAQIPSLKTLRDSVGAILGSKHDDVALNVLMYVINNEPVSMYRVAKVVPYNSSLTYKKANKLLREGLLRQIPVNDPKDHRCRRLFESTVKGLLTGWNLGYMDDNELLGPLRRKWDIGIEELSKFDAVFRLMPSVATERDTAVFEDLSVLAGAVATHRGCESAMERSAERGPHVSRYPSRYVLAQALKKACQDRTVIFASREYSVSYEPEWGRTYIYNCSLCDRECSMTEVSPRSPKCRTLNRLLSPFSLHTTPRT